MAYDFRVRTKQDLIDAVREYGIVPYFSTSVPGFSLEEHCSPSVLFSDGDDDTWAWKGPVIQETGCAYGKFFEKKAAYVSREVFLDLANYRRDGYDFDSRYDDGLARFQDKQLYDLIDASAPVLSKALRETGGYAYSGRWQKTDGKKGFDTIITRLQMECYLVVADFTYMTDKKGNPYGWGVARYTTPEKYYGKSFTRAVYQRKPEESKERLLTHFRRILPRANEKQLLKILG